MSGRDGTGPLGSGAMSGRGLGICTGRPQFRLGQGVGFSRRRGLVRNCVFGQIDAMTKKELLEEQKKLLEARLAIISKQLESV